MSCTYRINYAHKLDGCKSKGGVNGIAVATWTGGTGAITFLANANDLITGVTNSATTTFYFQAQHPEKAFANVKGDFTEDRLGGGYASEGSVYFNNNDYLLRKKVVDLVETQAFVIVKDNLGKYRLYGEEYGCYFGNDEATGTKLNDLNGATMTWTSKSSYSPRYIDATLAESLFDYDTVLTA